MSVRQRAATSGDAETEAPSLEPSPLPEGAVQQDGAASAAAGAAATAAAFAAACMLAW